MKFFTSLLLVFLLTLSACSRGTPPAEVIYRGKTPIVVGKESSIEVSEIEKAGQPKVTPPTDQVIIGLIVPLTGPQAEIGTQLRDAALMGLYDALEEAPTLEATATPRLLVQDSAGDIDTSIKAAETLIEQGAQVILGPLVAKNAEAVGRITRTYNVPLITFSNSEKIGRPGVYVFGFVPKHQVDRIANYAANQGIQHYAAIAPQDDYGRMVVRDFSKNLATRDLVVQPVEFFNQGQLPPSPVMSRIAAHAADVGRQRKGVFLPVTGQALSAISLRFMQDIKANNGFLKLLGTGLWDHPQTLRDPGMQGAWFVTTSPDLSYDYNTRFFDQYGYAPTRIASLAYDAVSIVASEGIRRGNGALTNGSLARKEGYSTPANGEVVLMGNGTVKRALAVIEVSGGGFRVVDEPRID